METFIIIIIFFAPLALFLFISCGAKSKGDRITGAILAFGWSGLIYYAANLSNTLEHNIWYSQSANDLLEISTEAIDAGNAQMVSTELSAMRDNLKVTYEHQGNFKDLAIATTKRIKSKNMQNNKSAEQEATPNP